MENPSFSCVVELIDKYLNHLRHSNGNLSAFWISYIDIVEIMLGLLRSSREGDWNLQLSSIREMIPGVLLMIILIMHDICLRTCLRCLTWKKNIPTCTDVWHREVSLFKLEEIAHLGESLTSDMQRDSQQGHSNARWHKGV